jgi:2-keto-4-pentenoate hydratase
MVLMNRKQQKQLATAFIEQLEAREKHYSMAEDVEDPSLDNAYLVQDSFIDIMVDRGERIVGWKVALTSKAMQEFCGVDHPLSGAVFESRVQASPSQVSLSDHRHLGLECEIAVRVNRDLEKAVGPYTKDNIVDAVEACYPAFELIEDRDADYDALNPFDSVSENAWNAGVILGAPLPNWEELDLVDTQTVLKVNGDTLGSGRTGDALGHPFEAVAWLANHLNSRDRYLRAGEFVMTGSTVITFFPQPGDQVHFVVGTNAPVKLNCS